MITFELEDWNSYFNDPSRDGLWREHYSELCTRPRDKPMSPDVPWYQFLQSHGMLQLLTARKRGLMVGYCIMVVKRHTHYDTRAAFEDSYFLTASERKKGAGLQMINSTLHHLKRRGVQEVYFMSKLRYEGVEKIFLNLGFEATDTVWMKWLGGKDGN